MSTLSAGSEMQTPALGPQFMAGPQGKVPGRKRGRPPIRKLEFQSHYIEPMMPLKVPKKRGRKPGFKVSQSSFQLCVHYVWRVSTYFSFILVKKKKFLYWDFSIKCIECFLANTMSEHINISIVYVDTGSSLLLLLLVISLVCWHDTATNCRSVVKLLIGMGRVHKHHHMCANKAREPNKPDIHSTKYCSTVPLVVKKSMKHL